MLGLDIVVGMSDGSEERAVLPPSAKDGSMIPSPPNEFGDHGVLGRTSGEHRPDAVARALAAESGIPGCNATGVAAGLNGLIPGLLWGSFNARMAPRGMRK